MIDFSQGLSSKNNNKLDYYYFMQLIRRFEEKAGQMYGMGLIGGFCHLYIGQEAVVVGAQSAINKDDAVITLYRDHGHMLVSGVEPKYVMAELAGKASGCSKGKGGSMHMFAKDKTQEPINKGDIILMVKDVYHQGDDNITNQIRKTLLIQLV